MKDLQIIFVDKNSIFASLFLTKMAQKYILIIIKIV
jgi:hypothetical protein